MRNLFFGLLIYICILSILFHDYVNSYSSLVGTLSACVFSGLVIGNILGEISLRYQERD